MSALFSCEKREISMLPFEVNHSVTCNDLYYSGCRRIWGVDVLLIGKKVKDTTVYFQVSEPVYEVDWNHEYMQPELEEESDTISKGEHKYKQYIEKPPLELSDSIYELVWGKMKDQQQFHCIEDKGVPGWRNYTLKIKKSEAKTYRNSIDTSKYKIINVQVDTMYNYNLDTFKVLNLKTKDTFNCSIREYQGEYHFYSNIHLKKGL